jgi:glycosyltransferase involved in cell wall biosynthesis
MRILMVSDFYPPLLGGVEMLVSSVSRELVRRGRGVAVATLFSPGLASTSVDDRAMACGFTASARPRNGPTVCGSFALSHIEAEGGPVSAGERGDKGAHVLLEAYRVLSEPPPLVLIGKMWSETPRELPAGVTLLRDQPNPAVRAAMRRCLALVAPSLSPEPFGIVVAEALTVGRPVVGSAIGGIPEIVRDGREGLLVPPGDVAALAGALERLCRDAHLRETLAADALCSADRYTPAAVLPRLEGAYERVAAMRR